MRLYILSIMWVVYNKLGLSCAKLSKLGARNQRAWADNSIANCCSLPSFLFGLALGRLQGKVLTHSEKVGWWKTLKMECVVSLFGYFD